MFIRIGLGFLAMALLLWVGMACLYDGGLLGLSKWLWLGGVEAFFIGMALLLLLGAGSLLVIVSQQLQAYWSREESLNRRLASSALKRNDQLQLFAGKIRQQRYFTQFKRNRLLQADDARQSRLLAQSVRQLLKGERQRLPKHAYQHLQMQLKQAAREQNVEVLLKLQQKISADLNYDKTVRDLSSQGFAVMAAGSVAVVDGEPEPTIAIKTATPVSGG